MPELKESSKEEKKSCNECAYLRFHFWGFSKKSLHESWTCMFSQSSIKENELNAKSCENFIRKKKGMTLEQQIEEQKQEQKKREELDKQARIAKEYSKLSNRLKRNWYYVSALIIALIALAITIWKFVLGK